MSGKILDTDFFNRLVGDEASQEAFHLLRRKMFEADAEAAKAKADAEAARVAKATAKAKRAEDKLTELEKAREIYFAEFGPSFLTDSLAYANKARKLAQAAALRFSSYVEEEVKDLPDGRKVVVGVKLKCVAQVPKKQKK